MAWDAHDREGYPEISVVRPVHVGADTDRDTTRPLVGSAESIIDDIERYLDVGVTRITLTFFEENLDEQVRQIRRFAEEVAPHFE
jgi:alkanesulfonate monooxygenase SsuD/methylene tetrahydromethanopterin reductase-like flavin-dependent oxidoreductase (luciferase family)